MRAPRRVDVARFALGIGALAFPRSVMQLGNGRQSEGLRRAIQVLGARHVVQSLSGCVLDRRVASDLGVGIDLTHAVSMVAVAGWVPEHHRLALASAGAALACALADLRDLDR
ncbi:MAG: hypothetical protein ACXVD4_05235 [Nocardioides sp.]